MLPSNLGVAGDESSMADQGFLGRRQKERGGRKSLDSGEVVKVFPTRACL